MAVLFSYSFDFCFTDGPIRTNCAGDAWAIACLVTVMKWQSLNIHLDVHSECLILSYLVVTTCDGGFWNGFHIYHWYSWNHRLRITRKPPQWTSRDVHHPHHVSPFANRHPLLRMLPGRVLIGREMRSELAPLQSWMTSRCHFSHHRRTGIVGVWVWRICFLENTVARGYDLIRKSQNAFKRLLIGAVYNL